MPISNGFSPGDVVVHTASLSGMDVRQFIRHFSVFENLKKPYTSIQMQLVDVVDLGNWNLGFDGANVLDISFGQPGQEPYTKTYSITSAQRTHKNEQLRVHEYELVGYSPQMTAFPKVQRSYKNQPLTDVARDLIETYLPIQLPLRVDAPSRGICGNDRMPYNINGVQIHKAIRQTLLRAASTTDDSSAYVFFENNHALIIDTLSNLIANHMGEGDPNRTFYQKPMGQNWLTDQMYQNFIIQSMQEESRVDKTAVVQAENVQSRPFDIFSNALETLNPFGGGGGGGGGGASTYQNIPYNILRPPTFLANVLPQRKRVAAAADQQSATFVVALNPYVTVGEGFDVRTLAPGGDTSTPVLDKLSGGLLCTECRHIVDLTKTRMQGKTCMKGIKGDMGIF